MIDTCGIVFGIDGRNVDFDALSGDDLTYALLEQNEVIGGHSIGLSDHWNEIDTGTKALHDLNVQWFQPKSLSAKCAVSTREDIRVSSGPDEEEASMHPEISFLTTLGLLLLSHISFMLVINKVDDGSPRFTVVDIVSKSWSINDREFDLEGLLF
jgi:hypothetical protein